MGKILFIAWLTSLSLGCYAQETLSGKKAEDKWKEIQQNSGEYLYGIGEGKTVEKASEGALSMLNTAISTQVESDFNYKLTQETTDAEIQAKEQITSITHSYSKNTLKNVSILYLSEAPKSIVVRYIKREDLEKEYEDRKNRALVCLKEAKEAKTEGILDDAFDKLYIAEMLARTCKESIKVPLDILQEKNINDYIADEKKAIAKDITIEETDIREDGDSNRISVLFKYKDKPVSNLNYAYEVNGVTSEVYTTNNGLGEITVPKNFKRNPNNKFNVTIGYFSGNINKIDIADRDVQQIVSPYKVASYKETTKPISRSVPQGIAEAETEIATNTTGRYPVVTLTEDEYAPYLETMKRMEVIIRNKNYSEAAKICTAEGFDMFNKLINYGSARLLKVPEVKFLRCGDDITCRSYPMIFSFKSSTRKFTENVVFHLNPEGKITEVVFALETQAANDILNNKNDKFYDNDVKQILVNFLERYKTAFALKRKDYIESIFSEDAIIIVGSVLKKAENYTDMAKMHLQEDEVRYTTLSKKEYINNLARCFDSNEYINIRFDENIFRHAKPFDGNDRLYSIQIKQDYFSQTYGDTGYLFLLLDLKDTERPIINIRAWQPNKDDRFKDNGRISLNDFTWE